MPNEPCDDLGIILCPSCGKLAYWHSHFGCYICEACGARTSESTLAATERERDEAQAAAAKMREALTYKDCHTTDDSYESEILDALRIVADAVRAHSGYDPATIFEKAAEMVRTALSSSAGRDFLTRYNEAERLLREAISILGCVGLGADTPFCNEERCHQAGRGIGCTPHKTYAAIDAYLKGGERVG